MKRIEALLAILAVTGCGAPSVADGRLKVVATFSTLASLVHEVGGDRIELSTLVPVGASPEDFQPAPADIATLHAARILFENGGGIETWLYRTIDNAKNPDLQIITLSDGLPKKGDNPHLWMDPVLAKRYVDRITGTLAAADPPGRAIYEGNARRFSKQLDALQAEIAQKIATIPPEHRAMIVFHNAWQYYNDRFGIRTVGVVELSPGQDPSPKYIAGLVKLARDNGVRAVFAEPEYSPKLVRALAESAGIATVASLYDDSIAASGPVRDYPSMLRYDTGVIVRALK